MSSRRETVLEKTTPHHTTSYKPRHTKNETQFICTIKKKINGSSQRLGSEDTARLKAWFFKVELSDHIHVTVQTFQQEHRRKEIVNNKLLLCEPCGYPSTQQTIVKGDVGMQLCSPPHTVVNQCPYNLFRLSFHSFFLRFISCRSGQLIKS